MEFDKELSAVRELIDMDDQMKSKINTNTRINYNHITAVDQMKMKAIENSLNVV
jgi:hypothetical protein